MGRWAFTPSVFNYAQSAATASRLIAQFGAARVLTRYADTTDPVAGTVTRVPTTYDVVAVSLPVGNSPQSLDDRYKDAQARGKLRMLYVSVGVVEPRAGDEIVVGGERFNVLGCTALDPTSLYPVLYTVGAELM